MARAGMLTGLGDFLLSQSEAAAHSRRSAKNWSSWPKRFRCAGRVPQDSDTPGRGAPRASRRRRNSCWAKLPRNGSPFARTACALKLSFAEGYSVGLFLDQRDNRRRLLTGHVAAGFPLLHSANRQPATRGILNTFAYTCGFSVCAAKAGARTTSLDLSKKSLEWGKRNFALNQLDPAGHDFIYGDVFDWLRRLAKKQRLFDVSPARPADVLAVKRIGRVSGGERLRPARDSGACPCS